MGMSVVVAMIVSVSMSMVKCHDADKVDKKPSNTDNEQLANAVHLAA